MPLLVFVVSSLVAIAALHASQMYLSGTLVGVLAGLAIFALVYAIAARVILREEYGYVMRAILRKRAV